MKKKKIPSGIQSFRRIRQGNYYYVDKTQYIHNMIEYGHSYFLSRPRRFGKSLLVDTIQCLFEGKKELFEGLYIYDHWDWTQKHPVIRLSFDLGENENKKELNEYVKSEINHLIKTHDLESITDKSLESEPLRLGDVIRCLIQKYGNEPVLLIDEYDKPILDYLQDKTRALKYLKYLKGLYSIVKSRQNDIHFSFITGISLFSKMNIFSGINNLKDISMRSEYTGICGYNEHEIRHYFSSELDRFDIKDIRRWYDGYCWDPFAQGEKIFCPESVLHLFEVGLYKNWWYRASIPEHIYTLLRDHQMSSLDFSHFWVDDELLDRFEVDNIKIPSLLFQSGFLTVKDINDEAKESPGHSEIKYLLGYPNIEVKRCFSKELLQHLIGGGTPSGISKKHGPNSLELLKSEDILGFKNRVYSYLTAVSFNQHAKKKSSQRNPEGLVKDEDAVRSPQFVLSHYEAWYSNALYFLFVEADCEIRTEEHTHHGRSDMVLITKDQAFVLELKCVDSAAQSDSALKIANQQVREKGYGGWYQEHKDSCYIVALVFGRKERNIVGASLEKLE